MRPWPTTLLTLLLTCVGPQPVGAGGRLEISASAGRASMRVDEAGPTRRTASTTVFREAFGVTFRTARHVRLGAELAWVERGGGLPTGLLAFHPVGADASAMARHYLELSVPVAAAWGRGRWGFEVGVAPRISVRTREPSLRIGRLGLRETILGIDPAISINFDRFFVGARHAWDLQPSYEYRGTGAPAEIDDSAWFLGLGLRVGS